MASYQREKKAEEEFKQEVEKIKTERIEQLSKLASEYDQLDSTQQAKVNEAYRAYTIQEKGHRSGIYRPIYEYRGATDIDWHFRPKNKIDSIAAVRVISDANKLTDEEVIELRSKDFIASLQHEIDCLNNSLVQSQLLCDKSKTLTTSSSVIDFLTESH